KINKKIESTEKIKTETGSNEPGYTDAQILQNELNETTVSYDGTSESFKVDTKSKNASWPILWESKSDIISIDPDGTVTVKRPSDREQEVKLIATITDGNITLSKSFDICVTATVGQKTILLPIHLTLTPPFK
ncbi:MAG: hypothetical protein NTY22_05420, partial [Proteobacteria bacterium]|nr:hypothetical protein [Pseudomonadota bacterium]